MPAGLRQLLRRRRLRPARGLQLLPLGLRRLLIGSTASLPRLSGALVRTYVGGMARRFSEDVFVEPTRAVGLVRQWSSSLEGLLPLLASLPPGATLEDALREHRASRQVGRRPSRCMQPEPSE